MECGCAGAIFPARSELTTNELSPLDPRDRTLSHNGQARIKLALFAASPVYTRSGLYRRVAEDPHIDFTAIFASTGGLRPVESGYGQPVAWDVELIDGYRSIFLRRADRNPIDGSFFSFRDVDVVRKIMSGSYDVLWLWGYNYLSHQLAAFSQILRRRPVLFHENQTLIDPRPRWKLVTKKMLLPRLFRRGHVLYVGSQNKRWFQHYGARSERMYFVPYAIDNERFRRSADGLRSTRAELRRSFGIYKTVPVILAVVRLVSKKQPLFLLDAFKRLRARHECALLIVGSGSLEPELRRQIESQAIPDVHMPGFINQSEISRAYACADLFTLVSEARETWGVAVNEAMNFALPIVVSDKVGCAADLVRDGENGFIVPSDNAELLADRLEALITSPESRVQFGAVSRRLVENWNYDEAAAGVLRAVSAAVGVERWAAALDGAGSRVRSD